MLKITCALSIITIERKQLFGVNNLWITLVFFREQSLTGP